MFNYILYRVGECISLYLPVQISRSIANLLSYLQYLFSRVDRSSVRENLKVILPGVEKRQLERYTRGVFINFGLYLVNFFSFRKIDREYIKKNVSIEGLEHIDKALSQGRGLMIVSAHIGNWELGGIALGLLGYPMNAITLTHKHKKVNAFFNRQRQANNLKVIPLDGAIRGCLEAFRRNEIVCILGDRDFTQGGVVMDLFGRPALIPKGPALFYLRNKVPIVVGFTVWEEEGRTRLFFNPQLEYKPCGDYETDVPALAGIYLRQIEDCIRRYPDQWAMFRRFWL